MIEFGVDEPVEGAVIKLFKIAGNEVGQRAVFEVIPELLDRIESGSVRRQILDGQPREVGQELPDRRAFVHGAVVPDQDDATAEMAEQVADERGHVGRSEVSVGCSLEVEARLAGHWRQGEAGDDRDFAAMARRDWQRRCLPPGREGATNQRVEQQPRLINQYDVSLIGAPFFRIRGQSLRTQASMRAWSRSLGIGWGRCGVMLWLANQPLRYRELNETPKRSRIRAATRAAVHSRVEYPKSVGLCWNHERTSAI